LCDIPIVSTLKRKKLHIQKMEAAVQYVNVLGNRSYSGSFSSLEKIRRGLQRPPVCSSASYRQKEGRMDLARVPLFKTQRRKCHLGEPDELDDSVV
jgi:hypothetical protein